ncbi:hypothetical protein SLS62_004870 [Diatrype stigma]|uniref:CobW C-terminal domain-containing protein n=1 Tax=Diatrype stigma TaxID=117547 RepID=A0AAN9YNW5_9PEZI
MHTADFLADRQANRADLPDEDDRNISDLQVDQVEFADVVVINKCDLVPAAEVDRIRGVVAQLNPGAKILTTARARLDVAEILDTGAFSYEKAALAAGWLKSLREEVEPETEEYGIGTFVYRARRPFHPARLWNTIKNVFVVIQEEMVVVDEDGEEMTDAEEDDDDDDEDMEDVEGDDDDDEEEEQPQLDPKKRLAAKMAHGTFGPLLRSKGFLWLATRSRMFGEWSQAGVMLTIQGGDAWRCEMPEADLLSLDPASRAVVVGEIEKGGRWGDRRQELVFIGQKMGADGGRQRIQDAMDACLLDDEEFRAWERIMERGGDDVEERLAGLFEDGFEDWVEPDAHGHDHGHDHGEDGQCSL